MTHTTATCHLSFHPSSQSNIKPPSRIRPPHSPSKTSDFILEKLGSNTFMTHTIVISHPSFQFLSSPLNSHASLIAHLSNLINRQSSNYFTSPSHHTGPQKLSDLLRLAKSYQRLCDAHDHNFPSILSAQKPRFSHLLCLNSPSTGEVTHGNFPRRTAPQNNPIPYCRRR